MVEYIFGNWLICELGIVVDGEKYLLSLYVVLLTWYMYMEVIWSATGCGGGNTFER